MSRFPYRVIVTLLVICGGLCTTSQASVIVRNTDPSRITVEYSLGDLSLTQSTAAGQAVTVVSLKGAVPQQSAGYPELPAVATSVGIPAFGTPAVRIISRQERELRTAPVRPSLGQVTRDIDPGTLEPFFGPAYNSGQTYPAQTVTLGQPFLLGDQRGVNVRLNPLRWDAARGVLLITDTITIEITTTGTDGINTRPGDVPASSSEMRELQAQIFPNIEMVAAGPVQDKYAAPVARGRMLIICDDALAPALAEFRTSKARRGIATEVILMSATDGTADGLRRLVSENYYAAPGLTWLVLVGDRSQVPTNIGTYDGSDADSPYAMIVGGDLYPDIFVSRISAVTLAQAENQIAKFVSYERDPDTGAAAAWYSRGAGVASDEGVPADYERADLLRTDLLSREYTAVDRIYQGLGASTATITDAVNQGRSLINYLGHGSGLSWDSVKFDTGDVAALSNGNRLPWIIDVSCFNGDFARPNCLAEAWLRAGTVANPAGAVGMIAASSLAPWTPPTVMQAEVVDLLTAGTRQTMGALYYSGLMRVLDEYAGVPVATQVIEQNIVFGDASLMVRTEAPENYSVGLPAAIDAMGSSLSLAVAGIRGGTVAVTSGDQLLGVADFETTGTTTVPLTGDLGSLSAVTVTVTGFNMVPWTGEVAVVAGASPVLDTGLPTRPVLRGNYPNPFNPSTRIVFELPSAQNVALIVYDIRGRQVRRLVSGQLAAGGHEIVWQGTDAAGRAVPSGIYLYRLVTRAGSQTGRMVLAK